MIIAVLPNSSHAESLLNNLSEADFKLSTVSLIMSDQKIQKALGQDAGPFKGVAPQDLAARLVKAGLPQSDTAAYTNAVGQGQVFFAMTPPPASQSAAAEMLQDASAQLIRVIP